MNRRSLLLGGAATLLSGCNEERPAPVPYTGNLSMEAKAWTILYSPSLPPHPDTFGNGWAFDFPQQPTTGVDYVVQSLMGSIAGRTLSVDFRIEGAGELKATEGTASARTRLFFQRRGDNLSAQGPYEFYRWWSTVYVELVPGTHIMVLPTDRAMWTSVYGRRGDDPAAQAGFAAACADIGQVGITFGGEFFGHGVYATGPSKFICDSYRLT